MLPEKIFRPLKGRWPLPREKWPGCAKLSKLLPVVLILTAVLCLPGCATTKKTQTEQTQSQQIVTVHDTVQTFTRIVQTEAVPESRVEMRISVDSLLKLPQGATYHRKSGQAHAEVSIRGDTIYVTGTCDSLARQVEYYEALYHNARDALESYHATVQKEAKTRESPLKIFVKGLVLGLVAGISLTFFIKYSKRRKNE